MKLKQFLEELNNDHLKLKFSYKFGSEKILFLELTVGISNDKLYKDLYFSYLYSPMILRNQNPL